MSHSRTIVRTVTQILRRTGHAGETREAWNAYKSLEDEGWDAEREEFRWVLGSWEWKSMEPSDSTVKDLNPEARILIKTDN